METYSREDVKLSQWNRSPWTPKYRESVYKKTVIYMEHPQEIRDTTTIRFSLILILIR